MLKIKGKHTHIDIDTDVVRISTILWSQFHKLVLKRTSTFK